MKVGIVTVKFAHFPQGSRIAKINKKRVAKDLQPLNNSTKCILIVAEREVASGIAQAGHGDPFSYDKGRKFALRAAFINAGTRRFNKARRMEIWEAYRTMPTVARWSRAMPKPIVMKTDTGVGEKKNSGSIAG
jgi:hypothetical protein